MQRINWTETIGTQPEFGKSFFEPIQNNINCWFVKPQKKSQHIFTESSIYVENALLNLHFQNGKLLHCWHMQYHFIYFNFVELICNFASVKCVSLCAMSNFRREKQNETKNINSNLNAERKYIRCTKGFNESICGIQTCRGSCHMHDALNNKFVLKDYRIPRICIITVINYWMYKDSAKKLNWITRIDIFLSLYSLCSGKNISNFREH